MQNTSALYKKIFDTPGYIQEVRVVIAGVQYTENDIVSLSTYGGMFDQFSVGNCAARQIDLTVFPKEQIPYMADMQVSVRLIAGDLVSEWIPKGTFYIDTRSEDKYTGALQIHGYDAMLKAEQLWNGTVGTRQTAAASNIASRIGVTLDSRTNLNTSYTVASDENGYTMREILSLIAKCNAGNWIITDMNTLLLIRLGDIPPETNLLVDDSGNHLLFGEVRILLG